MNEPVLALSAVLPSENAVPGAPRLRPQDAASLLILDRAGPEPRVLMGRRSRRHIFMPDVYVFPGGRRDRADSFATIANPLHPAVCEKLRIGLPSSASPRRIQALGVTALRETFEETGLRIVPPADAAIHYHLDLSNLRYLARAITPAGRPRRFDARFFVCICDEAGFTPADLTDSDELNDLRWVSLSQTSCLPLASITRRVLDDLASELQSDPALPFGRPVPFYRGRGGNVHRTLL